MMTSRPQDARSCLDLAGDGSSASFSPSLSRHQRSKELSSTAGKFPPAVTSSTPPPSKSACRDGEFPCGDGRCIDARWRCDGNNDCGRYQDEIGCVCGYDEFQCANRQCVGRELACDGFADCFDSSDEQKCGECRAGLKPCGDGQCVLAAWWCDGDVDCANSRDEAICSCESQGLASCRSGECLSPRFVCDGRWDCPDRSDEQGCDQITTRGTGCGKWEFDCGDRCVPVTARCDRVRDCDNDADETECGEVEAIELKACSRLKYHVTRMPNLLGHVTQDEAKLSAEYALLSTIARTKCHPLASGMGCAVLAPPAVDEDDRIGSPGSRLLPCRGLCERVRDACLPHLQAVAIAWPHFLRCEHFPHARRCLTDAKLARDECAEGEYTCAGSNVTSRMTSQCVPQEARCDGVADCAGGDDEAGCDCATLGRFRCKSDGACVRPEWVCDTHRDCDDRSDEQRCGECGIGKRKCGNNACVSDDKWCDGFDDCDDDEMDCVRLIPRLSSLANMTRPSTAAGPAQQRRGVLVGYNAIFRRWAPVCYGSWNERLGHLACRQMGFGEATGYATIANQPDRHRNLPRLPLALIDYRKIGNLQQSFDRNSMDCSHMRYVRLECAPARCGRRRDDDDDARPRRLVKRILGGRTSRDRTWPWLASLRLTGAEHVCGATLVGTEWLVSAAHCFQEREQVQLWSAVLRGVSSGQPSRKLTFRVQRIVLHPRYNPDLVDFDIALVKLGKPVPHVQASPLCLPSVSFDFGAFCMIAGWGHTGKSRRGTRKLQEGAVHIIDRSVCQSYYPKHDISERMTCAGHAGMVDTCSGDSGGPLMCWNAETQRWQLAGVTSWGSACKPNSAPGVYTDVGYFVAWVRSVIRRDEIG